MKKLIQQICTTLEDGEALVLVTVSSQSGSTPRLAGAKMIIHGNGLINGTIGGGLVEAQAMEDARDCFTSKKSLHRSFDLTNGDAAVSDMICGGRMELFLEYIGPDETNRSLFRALLAAIDSGRKALLVSPVEAGGGDQRFVVDHRGQASPTNAPPALVASLKGLRAAATTLVVHQGRRYLVSSFAVGGTVVLVGAGHVAACTAEAAARVGFRVVVMDDRREFANRERFPLADEIQVLPSFADCFQGQEIDADTYLVIVTRGHLHDLEVLAQALQTRAGYIGMIGSRKKRNSIYAKLMDQGVKEAQLEQVRCPIGMAIEADTPEEIAVSILGELIYQRATGRKAWHLA